MSLAFLGGLTAGGFGFVGALLGVDVVGLLCEAACASCKACRL